MPKSVRDLRSSTDAWMKATEAWLKGPFRESVKKFGMECEKERQDFKTYIRNFYG